MTHDLELERNHSEVENLYRGPKHEVCLESRKIYVLELPRNSSLSTTLRNSHEREETCQPWIKRQLRPKELLHHRVIPMGANISWSSATLLSAGSVAAVFVIGNALDRNENQ